MDDFVISNLHESRNEWCSRLVSIFTPLMVEGIRSIFDEAWKMCLDNDEINKYLMTFQNLLSRIPKWTDSTIEEERKRIIQRSGCNYLEDLITCVHIIQLKVLTAIRVGNKQKKIDITIPKIDSFIHRAYIHIARKVYTNVYLFEKNISPTVQQQHNRELEKIVQECILTTIRESIPTEEIIRAYMAEGIEHEEEVVIENIPEPVLETSEQPATEGTKEPIESTAEDFPKPKEEEPLPAGTAAVVKDLNSEPVITRLTFNNVDSVLDDENRESKIEAPKSIERLEEISMQRNLQRKIQEEEEEMEEKIKISTDNADLGSLDIMDLDKPASEELISLDDIEELF